MVKFYNTINRIKEEFAPIKSNKVYLYTCGPTVYDYAHIGNFRAYIFEDILRRYLEYIDYEVLHIMNITDIDDKTIKRSQEENIPLKEFTTKYTQCFLEDVEKLKILPAHHYPRATDFIPKMIEIIQVLESKGFTYKTDDGSVFYRISNFSDYGKLANINPEELKSSGRVEDDEYGKDEGRDFALWKGYKKDDGDVFWGSPWGNGRPGWHIECSAMSTHYLGNHFDIHCGGVDNIFPHHENEIAQSCAATGEPFVNYWLHNEHLLVDNQKMSKSMGNFYTLRDLLEMNLTPEAIRYTLFSTHYRSKLNFTFEKIKSSQICINRLRELKRRLELVQVDALGDKYDLTRVMLAKFSKFLADDLNISGALGELFLWVNDLFKKLDNNELAYESSKEALLALNRVDKVLDVVNTIDIDIGSDIELLIEKRNNARAKKDWQTADNVRKKLDKMGIALEDTPNGTIWKKNK